MMHAFQIAKKAGTTYNPAVDMCISREEHGELFGGSLIVNYTGKGGSCGIHLAGFRTDWLSRNLLWITYDYIFNQLACARLFGQTPADNEPALAFCRKNGFKELHRIAGVFPDGGSIVLSVMERADCRFLKLKPTGIRSGRT